MTDPRTGCDPDTPIADTVVILPTWGEIGLAVAQALAGVGALYLIIFAYGALA